MTRLLLAGVVTLGLAALNAAGAGAQTPRRDAPPVRRDTIDGPTLPGDVADDVAAFYNAPGTTRIVGTYDLPAGRTVEGDVAVLSGPVTVAGRITGRLLAVNTDVTFRPGARVDGDVTVVGGLVDGRRDAALGGELRIYRQPLAYRIAGDQLVPDEADDEESQRAWLRWGGRTATRRTYVGFTLSSGRTYNRVEGLPVWFGPTVEQNFRWGRFTLDAFGIFRTADEFRWDHDNVGHTARAELRVGRGRGLRVGGRLYDEVAPVEEWQLGAAETGLATFLLHRDFRDYYGRHGGTVYAALHAGEDASVTASLADQRWTGRDVRDPFTLFRNNGPWRANPAADEGRVHVANVTLRVDTRNDVDHPWAGWYVQADYERGTGVLTTLAPLSEDLVMRTQPGPAATRLPGRRSYGRGLLDVRRYNRLTPDAQLNFRAVAGGWLHGDELPAQRRFSVTGPGAIAGFDFREATGRAGADAGQCSVGGLIPGGAPAQCERMLLLQTEYRSDIRVRLFGEGDEPRFRRRGFRTAASWVLFANAGRGWLVRPPTALAAPDHLVYGRSSVPGFDTFLTDLGAGIELGGHAQLEEIGSLGVYVAKSVSHASEPANVFVRIRRRF